MVVPARRRLRTKTPPAAALRVPSMGVVRRRMRSKEPPPKPQPQPQAPADSGGAPGPARPGGGGDPPAGDGLQAPGGPPEDGGSSGGDSGGDAGVTPQEIPIKTFMTSSTADHLKTQTQVVTMAIKDVGIKARLP